MSGLLPKERLKRMAKGQDIDRAASVGGWMHSITNLSTIAGINIDEYMSDPLSGVIKANRALGVDAMVPPIVPQELDQIRSGYLQEETFKDVEPEALLERANHIPDTADEILAVKFDAAKTESDYHEKWEYFIKHFGNIVFLPVHWEAEADFSLYFQYGYEAFLAAIALYPNAIERIFWEDSILARARNQILIKLYREYDIPPILFCGHDICINTGPMCSPDFLRNHYWKHAKYSLEPLVESGIRIIGHCDGNVMPVIDDMVKAGFSGFQGFQYEYGVDPWIMERKRSMLGEKLLYLAGLSITRTLPYGTVSDVIEEVEYCLDYSDRGQRLLLFPSNVIGPEVPYENIKAGYRYIHEGRYDAGKMLSERQWPWSSKRK